MSHMSHVWSNQKKKSIKLNLPKNCNAKYLFSLFGKY